MSLHRRAAKRDANEPPIVKCLRLLGAQVFFQSAPGMPDLLVVWRSLIRLAEVKGKNGKLTPAQIRFHAAWTGPPIPILRDENDAASWLLSLAPHAVRIEATKKRHTHTVNELEDA